MAMCYTGKGSQTLSGLPVVLFYNYELIMLKLSHLQPGGRESRRIEMGDYIAVSCHSAAETLDQPELPPWDRMLMPSCSHGKELLLLFAHRVPQPPVSL